MIRALLVLSGLILVLGSCTQQLICPAYQSSFIYDKESLRKKFSYFREDSTPKILTASKSKYLIAVPESYRRKIRKMQTVEMKPVFPVIPDSLKIDEGEQFLLAEVDVVDSAAAATAVAGMGSDSVYAITKTKEKYNVDQDIYMWYFRDVLVLPDVRAAMETREQTRADAAPKKAKKKGLFSFLKKKDKTEKADSLVVPEEPVPADSTVSEPKKKGLKGIFGGKNGKSRTTQAVKKEDAKKEGDEGF